LQCRRSGYRVEVLQVQLQKAKENVTAELFITYQRTELGLMQTKFIITFIAKLQTYNKINGAIRRHFGKQMNKETKLRIHNITAKAALKFESEAWVLKTREEQRLEAAQMKFLRHLLRITKLDKETNQCIREKTRAQNIVKEIKQWQEKWLQHVQRMDTNRIPKQALQYNPKGA